MYQARAGYSYEHLLADQDWNVQDTLNGVGETQLCTISALDQMSFTDKVPSHQACS